MSTIKNGKRLDRDEVEIDFSSILHQLLEQKWLIIIITSICLGIGIYYSSKLIPEYQSDVLLQIEDSGGSGNGLMNSLSSGNIFFGYAQNNSTSVQKILIKSRYILDPVIQSLGLNIILNAQQTRFERLFKPTHATAKIKSFLVPKNQIDRSFTLVYDKNKDLKLYNNDDELMLQGKIGTRLTNKNNDIQLEIENINAAPGTKFTLINHSISKMVVSLGKRLKIEELGGSQQGTGLFSISLQDVDPKRATRIVNEVARVAQRKDAEKKSLEATKIMNFLFKQLPIVKESLSKAESAYNNYRRESGKFDLNMQTQALLQQIVSVDKQLNDLRMNETEMSVQYTSEHPTYIELQRRFKIIQKERDRLEQTIRTLPEAHQEMLNLMREVKTKRSIYTMILNKIQGLEIVKAGLVSNLKILSFANVPDSPMPLPKTKIYLGSLIIGFILSTLIIFGRKLLFPKIEDPHWTETQFNIPNLAIIPYSNEQFQATHDKNGTVRKIAPLLAQKSPRSLSVESLRSLRTSLQVNLSCSNNNIVSILGVSPGVGKSFVSSNLSYLLATAEKRVLLIDGDLRRGTAHRYFDVMPSPGFAELIQGTATTEQALKPTSHKNLTILPRGDYPSDPSELLSSESCKELLSNFSKQFDIVLIDTAPVLLVTDAVLLSGISATNYLVLGSKAHQPSDIEMVIKRLSAAWVTVHGSIFNFHNAASKRNSYYYKYYSYNYYYDDKPDTRKRRNKSLIT